MRKRLTVCGQGAKSGSSAKGAQKRSPGWTGWTSNRFQRLVAGSPSFQPCRSLSSYRTHCPACQSTYPSEQFSVCLVLTDMRTPAPSAPVNRDSTALGLKRRESAIQQMCCRQKASNRSTQTSVSRPRMSQSVLNLFTSLAFSAF